MIQGNLKLEAKMFLDFQKIFFLQISRLRRMGGPVDEEDGMVKVIIYAGFQDF